MGGRENGQWGSGGPLPTQEGIWHYSSGPSSEFLNVVRKLKTVEIVLLVTTKQFGKLKISWPEKKRGNRFAHT
ncbi:thioredoxin [Corchorus olitorius]|uniref:Thioredoxin n=1 Tax=Corchorus olitorius TaxID=93759 RepID=A0A1R3KQU7_9ROSI|nr:thioredoxin [Corchorus olitorius]